VAIENQTKATLYDELVKQFPKEMDELLEEAKVKFRKWHFEQIGSFVLLMLHMSTFNSWNKKKKRKKT
jgi:hypothetical protein